MTKRIVAFVLSLAMVFAVMSGTAPTAAAGGNQPTTQSSNPTWE